MDPEIIDRLERWEEAVKDREDGEQSKRIRQIKAAYEVFQGPFSDDDEEERSGES